MDKDKDPTRKKKFDMDRVKFKKNATEIGSKDHDDESEEQANVVTSDYDESRFECWLCHERNTHSSEDCPNVDVRVKYLVPGKQIETNVSKNEVDDKKNPHKKYRMV